MVAQPEPSLKVFLLRLEDPGVAPTFKARPAQGVIASGFVKFVNYTGSTVGLVFTDPRNPGGASPFRVREANIPVGTPVYLDVREDAVNGRYFYNGRGEGFQIIGESSPEIIIDR